VSAAVANAIGEGRRPAAMSDEEAILYDFCQELHKNKGISDATYARAMATFGEQAVVDTVGISGYYTMLAMVLNTARTPAGQLSLRHLQGRSRRIHSGAALPADLDLGVHAVVEALACGACPRAGATR